MQFYRFYSIFSVIYTFFLQVEFVQSKNVTITDDNGNSIRTDTDKCKDPNCPCKDV